ncbi:MAG: citrate/2-methylcitrate synthase [Clostridia bacterium]|nr:citrate/2-methylcitrate synthase [Clostridia bacterium]
MKTFSEKECNALVSELSVRASGVNHISPDRFTRYNVKRGLRNEDGTGVLTGLTKLGDVHGYVVSEGERVPVDGVLTYRGIDIRDIVENCWKEKRHGFDEVCYLLLLGQLPNRRELEEFSTLLASMRELPDGFIEDMILKAPSKDLMNKIARSTMALYSYDDNPDDTDLENLMRQSLQLVARMPLLTAYAYQAKSHYHDHKSLYIHSSDPSLSTAENFLHILRQDQKFEPIEAEILDLLLMIHAEHGGGNNSTFTTRVVSSSGTDTYSAIGAAIGSLKGPRHGGANIKVMGMMEDVKANVKDWANEDEVACYIEKILRREAYDHSGLVYGIGHAIYTLSDPRAVLLRERAKQLAEKRDMMDVFNLYALIEKLTPQVFNRLKDPDKKMCANVDLYSGFVYQMLDIPTEVYTPLFAISRVASWCAHRIEELMTSKKIIRPAYRNVCRDGVYLPIDER